MRNFRVLTVILIVAVIGYYALRSSSTLPICNLQTITQAIPVRIFAEQTIDGPAQSIFLTRFLHNKVGIFANELARCYFNVFDPNLIVEQVSFIGLILIVVSIYHLFTERKLSLIGLFLLIPFLSIFSIFHWLILTKILFWTFAIKGAIIFFKIHES